MQRSDLKVGGVYRAHPRGEEREIVRFTDNEVVYRVVANPRFPHACPVGTTRRVFTINFATWATEVVHPPELSGAPELDKPLLGR